MASLEFGVCEGWGKLPVGWTFTQVAGVVVDKKDRVYVFNRGEHPLVVFDREGKLLTSWGEGIFTTPHGIFLTADECLYLVDCGDHTVRKFTLDGRLLQVWGTPGKASGDGRPFNRPTDVAVAPSGDVYISDGYGNRRVHKFSPEGKLLLSWGKEGSGPGEFSLPHGIWVDDQGIVYVADREENNRIQLFTPEGEFLGEWPGFRQPNDVYIDRDGLVYIPELQHRVSILNRQGEVLARLGGAESAAPGEFIAPHTTYTDSRGDLYVGEVLEGQRLQKFRRGG